MRSNLLPFHPAVYDEYRTKSSGSPSSLNAFYWSRITVYTTVRGNREDQPCRATLQREARE
jgi:hypothetical protein